MAPAFNQSAHSLNDVLAVVVTSAALQLIMCMRCSRNLRQVCSIVYKTHVLVARNLDGSLCHRAMQVAFPLLLQALSAAFTTAPDAATAARLLAGLLQLTKLAGLLGLDRQCEAAVGVLAARCGVFNPAAPGTRPGSLATTATAHQQTEYSWAQSVSKSVQQSM